MVEISKDSKEVLTSNAKGEKPYCISITYIPITETICIRKSEEWKTFSFSSRIIRASCNITAYHEMEDCRTAYARPE